MASNLTDRLSRLVKTMRGQARITESNVQEMLREVRMALLEADVALPVVRDFITRVTDKALGAVISMLAELYLEKRTIRMQLEDTDDEDIIGDLEWRLKMIRNEESSLHRIESGLQSRIKVG